MSLIEETPKKLIWICLQKINYKSPSPLCSDAKRSIVNQLVLVAGWLKGLDSLNLHSRFMWLRLGTPSFNTMWLPEEVKEVCIKQI